MLSFNDPNKIKYFSQRIRNSLLITLLFSLPMTTFASNYIIHGVKFLDDQNDEGSLDSGEARLINEDIFLKEEASNNSLPPLHLVTTDINGNYSFEIPATSSSPKKFKIWSVIPSGYKQTSPLPGGTGLQIHEITLLPDELQEVNFGIRLLPAIIIADLPSGICNNPQRVESSGDHTKNDGWRIKTPEATDVAFIKSGHTVLTNSVSVKTLCIENGGTLQGRDNDLTVTVSGDIYNDGQILGASGDHNHWNCSSNPCNYESAKSGKNVTISADKLNNGTTGKIQGGIAGQAIAHGQNVNLNLTGNPNDWQSISLVSYGTLPDGLNAGTVVGGHGGYVDITVSQGGTNHGLIGSAGKPTYSNGGLISGGSNGGIASLASSGVVNCPGSTGPVPVLGTGFTYGTPQGGTGGEVRINVISPFGMYTNSPSGQINSGYGGDARAWSCSPTQAGQGGGNVQTIPVGKFINQGSIRAGGDGIVYYEPEIILVGADTRINDAKEIIIFAGDNSKLTLGNLSTDAIVAQERIVVATGAGGIIDLRGGNIGIFNAPTVEFYTDNLMKDEGVNLTDLVSANSSVEQQAAKILYVVSLSGTGTVQAEPGAIVSTPIQITNIGPTEDTYQLTAEDLQGWSLSLPATITVEGLHSESFQLDITLPAAAAGKNTIKIIATSQKPESEAKAQMSIEATVLTSPQYCCSYQTELGGQFCSVTDITFEQCQKSAKLTGAKVFRFGTGTCFNNACAGAAVQEYLKAELAFFKATAFEDSVHLDWQSLSEENEAYFVVYRGIPINGNCDENNLDNYKDIKEVARINAKGTLTEGAFYTVLDNLPKEGETFCYLLEDRELDGQKDRHWEFLQAITGH